MKGDSVNSTHQAANRVPTPLTDALCEGLFHDGGPTNNSRWTCSEYSAWMIAEHARRMEADRAELREALFEARNIIRSHSPNAHAAELDGFDALLSRFSVKETA